MIWVRFSSTAKEMFLLGRYLDRTLIYFLIKKIIIYIAIYNRCAKGMITSLSSLHIKIFALTSESGLANRTLGEDEVFTMKFSNAMLDK